MSRGAIRPSTLEGIKRLAKSIKFERCLQHVSALDAAAQSAGFQNFRHARNVLKRGAERQRAHPRHGVFVTVYWCDEESGGKGRETLLVQLDTAWSGLVTPAQLRNYRSLAPFRRRGPDHLVQHYWSDSQSTARAAVCAAARALQFMDATKLRPSTSYRHALSGSGSADEFPGCDHYSVWYEPSTQRYLVADEPYERAAESLAAERAQWAQRHGFTIVKPSWPGMYNPRGGSRLYLVADSRKGVALAQVAAALAQTPAPINEKAWNGQSAPATPLFRSPGTIAQAHERDRA